MNDKDYISPELEVLCVLVERGYGASTENNNNGGLGLPEWGII